jgi:hypothetical protein
VTVRPVVILYKRSGVASTIELPLDEAAIAVSEGGGGWEILPRPLRKNATNWVGGIDPIRFVVPVLYNLWPHGDLEPWCAQLEWFASRLGGQEHPAVLRVAGFLANPIDWVIEKIEWGDSHRNPHTGRRARVTANVHLLEFVSPDVVGLPTSGVETIAAWTRQVVVGLAARIIPPEGGAGIVIPEDLPTLAVRYMGDFSRWGEIAVVNGLDGPRSTYVGQVLRMPV